jgi:hypothetical protein
VYLTGNNARSNYVFGNYIGTDASGTGPLGNSGDGVTMREHAILNQVGNGGSTGRNIISGNLGNGVLITGTLASDYTGNTVIGNYIGTNVDGSVPVSNTLNGVALDEASNNTIGDWGTRNVISGNGQNGVLISGTTSSNNNVRGNYIGTNADGTLNVGNNGSGVYILSASDNLIGGSQEGYGNVISGNFDGVRIARRRAGQFADNNRIQGNFLGTNAAGTAAIGNYVAGVSLLLGARNTVVGGAQPAMRNLISGNVTFGVIISGANENKIQNNYVGTNASATGPVPNLFSGIYISDGYTNTIGGGVGLGNLLAYNGEHGVLVDSGASNVINTNSIYSNSKLGINLASSGDWQTGGVSANDALDPDDGSNKVQNYPVLSASSTQSQVKGSLNSLPNTTFTIEFFTNDTCDNTGYGEGKTFLGTTVVTTGGNGNASFTFEPDQPVPGGSYVTATATDPSGNTSEFSACLLVQGPATASPTSTSTSTSTATSTSTSVSTATNTSTSIPSATNTVTLVPSATRTATAIATATNTTTGSNPTATNTSVISNPSATATRTATSTSSNPSPTATSQVPGSCQVSFTDVPEGSTFYSFVQCLACKGILGGYSDGTFRTNNDVTRGQLSKIVSNAAGFNEAVTGQTFSDVAPDSPFYAYVERMVSRGIISGYGDGTFRPNNNATRGQISKIVANARNYTEPVSGQTFSDVAPDSPFYAYIERMVSRGIISGYGDGTFRPNANATRGQTAKIVSNAFFPNCQTP